MKGIACLQRADEQRLAPVVVARELGARAPARVPPSSAPRGTPRRCGRAPGAVRTPAQAVVPGEPLEVALVEQLDLDLGIELAKLAQLAVLAGDERLLHHRHLEVEILLRKVEVGREGLDDPALRVAREHERRAARRARARRTTRGSLRIRARPGWRSGACRAHDMPGKQAFPAARRVTVAAGVGRPRPRRH